MFLEDQADNKKKLKQLLIKSEQMEREVNNFFQNLGITAKDLNKFLADKSNFSGPQWEIMQQLKNELEKNLDRDLDIIHSRFKPKSEKDKTIPKPKWLYVR